MISSAICAMRDSQSGGGIEVLSVIFSLDYWVRSAHRAKSFLYFWAWTASNMSRARRKFLPLSFATLLFSPPTSGHPSMVSIFFSTLQISWSVGAETLINNVRDRIGAIIFEMLFANSINLRFGLYFSIVLLSAAWASRVKWSASLMTTTLNRCLADWSTCCVCATSFKRSWMTTLSKLPTSEGVISRWYMDATILNSSFRFVVVWNTRQSILIFSTPGP